MDAILSVFGGSESFEFQREIYCLLWVVVNSTQYSYLFYMSYVHNPYYTLKCIANFFLNCASWKYDYKLKIIYSSAHRERDSYAVGNYWLLKNNICLIWCSTCSHTLKWICWSIRNYCRQKTWLFCCTDTIVAKFSIKSSNYLKVWIEL